ncbi:XkdF-like putative serine protease domain-containing protein [Halomarina rubra]|uniref:XkdF-like putative serine protease domain-containing protein n=1 Tax=Halomarina rubra TaxID=2071873 RepID=A0ABD6B254_9EURY|nr:XkdF-like putative serine protease domain-containing protein [Halomarina rubra]
MTDTPTQLRDASPEGEFSKDVPFEKLDDEERIARGAVMVPNELDHQGDFVRPETIASLRENFSERVESGDALPGVMHAVFPDEGIELADEYQVDEAVTLGDEEYPEGTWIAAWKFTDDDLWALVRDGVLGGNSIGGTAKGVIHEPGTLPDDVAIPDAVQSALDEAGLSREDIVAREITAGRILEVSNVDYPAVPRATHEEHSASISLSKAQPALTDNIVAARLALEARGHSEEDARRLAEYLQTHKAAKRSLVQRAKDWAGLGGGDDGTGQSTTKDGRTLSQANVTSAKAVHDATLDMLDRSDVDHGRTRFSDDPNDAFDIAAYGTDSDERAEPRTGGSSSSEASMNDELETRFNDLDERIERIEAAVTGDGDGEAEQTEKTTDGGDEPSDVEKAIERLASNQQQMAENIEQMASAQGVSQQADQGTTNGEQTGKTWDKSPFAPRGGN